MHTDCRTWGCISINQHAHLGKCTRYYSKGSINSAMAIHREKEEAPICCLNGRQKRNSFQ